MWEVITALKFQFVEDLYGTILINEEFLNENYQSTFSTLSEVKSSKESRNAEKGSKVKAYLMTVEYKGKEYIYLDDDTSVSNSDIMYIKNLE